MAEKFNIYKALREWRKDKRLSCYHRDFLNFVTEMMNAAYWEQPLVSFSIAKGRSETGMGKRKFLAVRKELVEYGWLEYHEGTAGSSTASYRAIDSNGSYGTNQGKSNGSHGTIQDQSNGSQGTIQGSLNGSLGHLFIKKNNKKELIKESGEAASVGQAESSQGETLVPIGTITLVENVEPETMIALTPHPNTLVSKKEPRSKRSKTLKVYTPPPEIAEALKVFLGHPGFKEAWQTFKAQHERKRGKMSTETKDLMFRDIVKWSQTPQVAIAILEYSIKGSYPMLYEPKKNTQFKAPGGALPSAGAPKNPNYKDSWD